MTNFTNFNITPYYDDLDETKKFLRVLFKPGEAVQARELTQAQSLLTQQLGRMGNHLFTEGTMVIPGGSGVNLSYSFVKLQDEFDSSAIDVADFNGQTIIGLTSGAIAEVVESTSVDIDPNTLFVKYQTGDSTLTTTGDTTATSASITNIPLSKSGLIKVGMKVTGDGIPEDTFVTTFSQDTTELSLTLSNAASATATDVSITFTTSATFADNETISTLILDSNGGNLAQTALIDATGEGSASNVDSGIYYVQGNFVMVDSQSILLDKYSNTPSYRIGFDVVESFVTSLDDTTLLDPAQGSPNENAPGADRWKVDLVLAKRALDTEDDANFVEIIRISNGRIEDKVVRTSFSELENTLARRTFDESGNYSLRGFTMDVREHLLEDMNRGVFTADEGGDSSKLALGIAPGKAYIKGFELETFSTQYVAINKGRDFAVANNNPIRADYGNYVEIDNVEGTFDVTGLESISLRDAENGAGTEVGTAKVRNFVYSSGTIGTASAIYKIYLFDINMVSGKVFSADVRSIRSSSGSPIAVGDCILAAGEAVLSETNKNVAIFKSQQPVVKTFDVGGNGIDTNFAVQRLFTGTASGTSITFTAGTNEIFPSYSDTNYHLSAGGAVIDLDGSIVVGGSPVGKQITITNPFINNADVELIAQVNQTVSGQKSKTLEVNHIENIDASSVIQLEKADIFRLVSIVAANGEDVTNRYELDDGQRDNLYARGKLSLRLGATAPTGTLEITYDYFEHGSGDYFSVDSYSGVVDYEDIPTYISPTTGTSYELRDSLDFRPRENDAGTGFSVTSEIPVAGTDITVDFEYFIPRIDLVYMDPNGKFQVKEGVSGLEPSEPSEPTDGMSLYTLFVPPYTFDINNVDIKYIDNRNYTMRDIGKLAKRIENVEYYTSFTLLEQETSDLFVDDGTGVNRLKNGFLVDNFTGHKIGDVSNVDYACSIDGQKNCLRPQFFQSIVDLTLNESASANYSQKTDLVTLPYTTTVWIDQPYASTRENVNPYAVINWVGGVELIPSSDNWREVEQRPDVIINQDGNFDQVQSLAESSRVLGTTWNDWQINWIGEQIQAGDVFASDGRFGAAGTVATRTVPSRNLGETRTGIQTTVVPDIVRETISSRVVDFSVIPFMRAIEIIFEAKRLKPNTRVFPFFDNIDVTDFVTPTGGVIGDPIFTNEHGEVTGTFMIPNTDTIRFRVGTRQFKLTDSPTNNDNEVNTSGSTPFIAAGVIEQQENTILAVRNGVVESRVVTETQERTIWWDPLAQSFLVNQAGGIFLDKIDIFFQSKDTQGIPVTLQIRTMENGTPTQKVVPFSTVTINPDDVTVASDINGEPIETSFSFADPVYLQDGVEYCFVLLSNSNEYHVWTAFLGEDDINTGRRISKNPYEGVMLKSQNTTTRTPIQEQDITFKIHQCIFDTEVSPTVIFENAEINSRRLIRDPFTTTDGSTTIFVNHPDHGLNTGARVIISGVADFVNGIPSSELNTTHTISNVELDAYEITVTTAANATGSDGGEEIRAISDLPADVINVITPEFVLPNTQIDWSVQLTDADYNKSSNFVGIIPNENLLLSERKVVANSENETDALSGTKSFTLRGVFTSLQNNITPLVDTRRISTIGVSNRVNNDSTDETNAMGGNSIARYITRRVTLNDQAMGLRVYLDASLPSGSSIEIYHKTLRDDSTETFDAQPYVLMNSDNVNQNSASEFKEFAYTSDDIDNFSTFAIKIVMKASNTANVPKIKNFRAIAFGT